MEFGESDSRNLAKSLLSLHRKDSDFQLRFATLEQARSVASELQNLGCRVEVDDSTHALSVRRPAKVDASVR